MATSLWAQTVAVGQCWLAWCSVCLAAVRTAELLLSAAQGRLGGACGGQSPETPGPGAKPYSV